jgi:hypothetical protein
MMNRRNFFSRLILGGLTILGVSTLIKAFGNPPPIQWSILEKGKRTVYRFHKGPDFTTLEDAFPYMQNIVDKVTGWNRTDESVVNRVVFFDSVNLTENGTRV